MTFYLIKEQELYSELWNKTATLNIIKNQSAIEELAITLYK